MTTTPTPPAEDPFSRSPEASTAADAPKTKAVIWFERTLESFMSKDALEAHADQVKDLRDAFGEFASQYIATEGEPAAARFTNEVTRPVLDQRMDAFSKAMESQVPGIRAKLGAKAQEIEDTTFKKKYDPDGSAKRVPVIKSEVLEPAFDAKTDEVKAEGMSHASKAAERNTPKLDKASDPGFATEVEARVNAMVSDLLKGGTIDKTGEDIGLNKIFEIIAKNKLAKMGGVMVNGEKREERSKALDTILAEAADYIRTYGPKIGAKKDAALYTWLRNNRGSGVNLPGLDAELTTLSAGFGPELEGRFFGPENTELLKGKAESKLLNEHRHLMERVEGAGTGSKAKKLGEAFDAAETITTLVDPADFDEAEMIVSKYLGGKDNDPDLLIPVLKKLSSIPDTDKARRMQRLRDFLS